MHMASIVHEVHTTTGIYWRGHNRWSRGLFFIYYAHSVLHVPTVNAKQNHPTICCLPRRTINVQVLEVLLSHSELIRSFGSKNLSYTRTILTETIYNSIHVYRTWRKRINFDIKNIPTRTQHVYYIGGRVGGGFVRVLVGEKKNENRQRYQIYRDGVWLPTSESLLFVSFVLNRFCVL